MTTSSRGSLVAARDALALDQPDLAVRKALYQRAFLEDAIGQPKPAAHFKKIR